MSHRLSTFRSLQHTHTPSVEFHALGMHLGLQLLMIDAC